MGLQGSEFADHFWMIYEYIEFWTHVKEFKDAHWDDIALGQIERQCFPFDLRDGLESMNKDPENQRNNVIHISRLCSSVCRNALCYDLRGRPWGRWRALSWDVPVDSPEARLFPLGGDLNATYVHNPRSSQSIILISSYARRLTL